MGTIAVTKNGSLAVESDDLQMSAEKRQQIQNLSSKIAQSKSAVIRFQKEIAKLELELEEESPKYRKILKLKRKISMLKHIERDSATVLDATFEEATKGMRGSKSLADVWDEQTENLDTRRRLPRGRK